MEVINCAFTNSISQLHLPGWSSPSATHLSMASEWSSVTISATRYALALALSRCYAPSFSSFSTFACTHSPLFPSPCSCNSWWRASTSRSASASPARPTRGTLCTVCLRSARTWVSALASPFLAFSCFFLPLLCSPRLALPCLVLPYLAFLAVCMCVSCSVFADNCAWSAL